MIINFANATAFFTALIRTNCGGLFTNQANTHAFAEQRYRGYSAGSSMFGMLVSSDAAQDYLR